MSNRILEIVVLMIDYLRENQDPFLNIDDLSTNLKARGYTDSEISSAYSWLMERYDSSPDNHFSNFPPLAGSQRILSADERFMLELEAQGFLLKLLSSSLIDNEQFESILERSAVIATGPLSLEQVKMVASSVIFRDIEEIEQAMSVEFSEDNIGHLN